MDPASTASAARSRYASQQETKVSSRIRINGGDVGVGIPESQGFAAGDACSSMMHEESQSGDGPHPPAVGSAHHIVKQSEGHRVAAAASVLSTFIAVDVCFLF